MLVSIPDADGRHLDARIELAPGAIVLHSRGGAFGKPNLRNPDYRHALRLILDRLQATGASISGVWLDSSVAQRWPESERLLVGPDEIAHPVDQLVMMIGQRGAAKGRPEDGTGHGNSTKRIRIGVPDMTAARLQRALQAVRKEPACQLPAATQRLVTARMIDSAIAKLQAGAEHHFSESRDCLSR